MVNGAEAGAKQDLLSTAICVKGLGYEASDESKGPALVQYSAVKAMIVLVSGCFCVMGSISIQRLETYLK